MYISVGNDVPQQHTTFNHQKPVIKQQ